MAIARVRLGHAEAAGSGSSIACTVNGIAAASLVVCMVTVENNVTISNIHDDLSVNAAVAAALNWTAGVQRLEHRYFKNYGGGNRTFTAAFSAATTFRGIVAIEYSGADTTAPAGPTHTGTGTSATPSSGAALPTNNGALFVGSAMGGQPPSAASPFTVAFNDPVTLFANTEDYIQSTAASLAATWTMTSDVWGAIVSTFYPASSGGYTLTADTGSFSLTGNTAAIKAARKITAAPGSFATTAVAAVLRASRRLAASTGLFNVTGAPARLLAGRRLAASAGVFNLTGNNVRLLATRRISAAPGAFALTGFDAILTKSGGGIHYTLAAETGVFTFTGNDARLLAQRVLHAEPGAFMLSGNPANLVYSGAIVVPPVVGGGRTVEWRRARRYEEMMRELAELERRAAEQEAIAQQESATKSKYRYRKAKAKAESLREQAAKKAAAIVAAIAAQEAEDEEIIIHYLMERMY